MPPEAMESIIKRTEKSVQTVRYDLTAKAVERAIKERVIEAHGNVLNETTKVTLNNDGSASVVTIFEAE